MNSPRPRTSLIAHGLGFFLLGLAGISSISCAASPTVANTDLLAGSAVRENTCSAGKLSKRPFVVEWDATDLADFEALSERDVIVVRYENCELEVLDGCNDPGVPGALGVYSPPKWTTGTVESFSIHSESELYAKLPLGAVKFGADVRAGQSLELKYFVSGVVRADRGTIYGGELSANPNCQGATHFVSSYSLGAFLLGASSHASGGAQASVHSVGLGGGSESEQKRLKQAGKIESCESNSATELRDCRAPIRLGLRPITAGPPPQPKTGTATSRPESTPTATGIAASLQSGDDGAALRASAREKSKMGDGKGCLADLKRATEIDPDGEKGTPHHMTQSICLMQIGECEAGRQGYREYLEQLSGGERMSEVTLDEGVILTASKNCPTSQQKPAERSISLALEVRQAKKDKDRGRCARLGLQQVDLLKKLPHRSDEEARRRMIATSEMSHAVDCLARTGDCVTAKKVWLAQTRANYPNDADFARQKERFTRAVRECR